MKFMLDTNICIYLIKRQPPHILEKLAPLSFGDVGVSAITLAELQVGLQKSLYRDRNRHALDQFLVPLIIADFDYAASVSYGTLRAALERQGTPIGSLDTLIAAHALSLDATLVTHIVREFSRVPGLKLVDWVQG